MSEKESCSLKLSWPLCMQFWDGPWPMFIRFLLLGAHLKPRFKVSTEGLSFFRRWMPDSGYTTHQFAPWRSSILVIHQQAKKFFCGVSSHDPQCPHLVHRLFSPHSSTVLWNKGITCNYVRNKRDKEHFYISYISCMNNDTHNKMMTRLWYWVQGVLCWCDR